MYEAVMAVPSPITSSPAAVSSYSSSVPAVLSELEPDEVEVDDETLEELEASSSSVLPQPVRRARDNTSTVNTVKKLNLVFN